ncbi:hypothetical protein [Deinococcus sedimenti]|uniref:Knr4/Smi1-like domain-containing protein n=1 Tax=Deinococcus sedimenti TaxID=1867090 RepID=A0ABQ2RYX1_9DEIO|nr:hypothetical protein [Deinococcus sedimenti]GGR81591.1 hypothetical protein GCM10008960_05700 [Deinococcus sedimenti]
MNAQEYWQPYLEKYCDVEFSPSTDKYLCDIGLPSRLSWESTPSLSHFNIHRPELFRLGLSIGGQHGIYIYIDKFDEGVYVYDPALDTPVWKINSNIGKFLEFLMLYRELIYGRIHEGRASGIIEELYGIDPGGFGNYDNLSDSWWGYYFKASQEELIEQLKNDEG